MQKFMDKDFLLTTETAKKLYHEHAEKMPIIDYHCHLQPKEIYEDKKFRNLAEVWLGAGDRYGDHYKWRSLRARGYEEDSISGPDDDYKKYYQFVESMPYFVGNPLYHWSHLEMQRYFGINDIINAIDDENLSKKIEEQLADYEKIVEECLTIFKKYGKEKQDINPVAKMSSYMMSKMKLMKDSSSSAIAKMMIEGSNKGIIEITEKLNNYPKDDQEIVDLANKLLDIEQKNLDDLKDFL